MLRRQPPQRTNPVGDGHRGWNIHSSARSPFRHYYTAKPCNDASMYDRACNHAPIYFRVKRRAPTSCFLRFSVVHKIIQSIVGGGDKLVIRRVTYRSIVFSAHEVPLTAAYCLERWWTFVWGLWGEERHRSVCCSTMACMWVRRCVLLRILVEKGKSTVRKCSLDTIKWWGLRAKREVSIFKPHE